MDSDQIVNMDTVEYLNDVNLIIFNKEAFLAVYKRESEFEVLSKSIRSLAVKQELLTRNHYPASQRLTEKAIDIYMSKNIEIE